MTDETETQARYIVPGLVRGLAILQAFSNEDQELGISEIARKVETTRSTAFRLVYTLEHLGYLEKIGDSKRYRIGSRVLDLGYSFLSGLDLVELAQPILIQLRDGTNTSSQLTIRDGREIVYVARCNSRMFFTSTVNVGTRLPAHATAPGRTMLAGLSAAQIAALFEGAELRAFTEQTPTTVGALINLLEQDRESDAVVSWGYFDPNVSTVAAPVRDQAGTPVAAVSVSCPMGTYTRDDFESEVRPQVIAAALALSRSMGSARQN